MFQKSLNINFHDNPSSGSLLVSRGRADELTNGRKEGRTDGQKKERQTVMMKLIVAFRNFANAPKNHLSVYKPFVYILYCLSNY